MGFDAGSVPMKQFMDTNVNDSVLESARRTAHAKFRIFWTIAMPMVKPAWLTLIIYSFLGTVERRCFHVHLLRAV